MHRLDGAAGGGQLLRTALSLSLVTGESFEMDNIRGNRSTPGLRPQHVACVSVAGSVANADVDGEYEGSSRLQFSPDGIRADPVEASVGTAGSTTLVCETLLPVAVALDDPLSLTVTGGTDVRWSPPTDYLRHVKRPLCSTFGVDFDVNVSRRGFYPAGGGKLAVRINPAKPKSLDLLHCPQLDEIHVYSVASEALSDASVGERQVEGVRDALAGADIEAPVRSSVSAVESTSPGTAVVVVARSGDIVAGFDAYGERGVPAEAVGEKAAESFLDWYRGDAPVDHHMADQLLVWVALVGGRVRIPEVTEHVRTNLDVIRAFGYEVDVRDEGESAVVERVE
ncbi:RNA 3'-terminal phosphate cyclase [Haloferax mediterranei ATCC 33500]|uniref:RNA 3'-terminal phosphate cyclase n=1 Tax=Haloferax mediterranei (strain ATCC 33500 / DSM 1411 / JCM 8866 / NBRC 14739 / NCIMB 2177 / R-4) TaxID=523841 RepID=I3R1L9_HALMT|nr:RNA 3'-terminal phosphate cyclase [Haloferax mediterranei]AFK18129.1 RNA 3'-terminal phosphate cyclase [Haloferax mediterranei ATCC 33500]AHZ22464.1 ribosomal subunit interface protein [Haloferax mediterranei ATCC 33500]EMA02598.1 RNA 3'-terminal-phosphate cyclase [Haloferax mediterranei ATCC 33500]MDX5988219.1 RNA 3'-terminal phosphate cyclase [Haloferax mediterranei ATCC 33500]QCQ74661.1 RNA 3'-terminal phosphate cyclase [Haloferax mediterranei ATCC 33500]